MTRVTVRRPAWVARADGTRRSIEVVAGEEPLELRVNGTSLAVTMRTPGHDFELVAGLLVAEGVVGDREQLASLRYCAGVGPDGSNTYNVVDAHVVGVRPGALTPRRVTTTSACGTCGAASIDEVRRRSSFGPDEAAAVDLEVLLALPDRLLAAQTLFAGTGGVHAAGLFSTDGELLVVREDVGRHNAVDKVVGWGLQAGRLPLRDTVLQVSGRASFELVQKCHMAGIGIIAAVGAPSSLAVDLAAEAGVTLAAFSRGDRVTLYAHPERVRSGGGPA